jgi:3-phosphoshikimate 1-carboxyvinyltransferase
MVPVSAHDVLVTPSATASGQIRVPGDKSISHRYAMLAAIADGVSTIDNYSPGADCASTLACLRGLGVDVSRAADGRLRIAGRGAHGLAAPSEPLDAGNSGTTMRLLSGILAAQPFRSQIGGDASLSRRPMRRVIEPLTRMGAAIGSHDGKPPLTIDGAALAGIEWQPEVPSAQVKSCVLLAGLRASGETTVIETAETRDHTERAFAEFGVRATRNGSRISVRGGQALQARALRVPGDISSAAFWMALAAGTPGASIVIEDVGLNPSRTGVLEILKRAGAALETESRGTEGGEPSGAIRVGFGTPRSFAIDPEDVPGVIDEIPALAALASLMPHGTGLTVRGAAELRVKESDRISALAHGLRALGSEIEEYEDGFTLVSRPLRGATVDAVGDHRLAMAFAIAATGAASPTTINGASSVDVSYPGFFDELRRLTGSLSK